ncbi:MAG: AI-2E family transporter [Candidatus Nomurabacteria bacterium]|jgi:predicted PurR-regulated permease PerM|nr:AI-2E family transporter [Candidatus Nomurabacteria bacterium]
MSRAPKIRLEISAQTVARVCLVVLAFAAGIAAIVWLRPALAIIFISFFLAVIFDRPVSFLTKYIKVRVLATLLVMIAILAILTVVIWALVPLFVSQLAGFTANLPDTLDWLKNSTGWLHDVAADYNLEAQYTQIVEQMQNNASNFTSDALQGIVNAFGGLLNSIIVAVMVVVMTFFMLLEGPMWAERFWRLVYKNPKQREHHRMIVNKMYDVVSGYVNGTAVIASISAGLTGLGLLVVGTFLPLPQEVILPSMMIVFVCAFIPMFGAFIAGVILAALLALYNLPAMLIFIIYFFIYQQIENNIFVPKIFARTVNISPLTVLLAVVAGTYCGGLIGIFIAIPVAGCLQVVLREYVVKRKLNVKNLDYYKTGEDSIIHKIVKKN